MSSLLPKYTEINSVKNLTCNVGWMYQDQGSFTREKSTSSFLKLNSKFGEILWQEFVKIGFSAVFF